MRFRKLLEVLRKKAPRGLSAESGGEESSRVKLRLLALRSSGSIVPLMVYLKSDDPEIRHLACKAVVELFSRISTKNKYHETVKNAEVSMSDLDFYRINFPASDYLTLLAVTSFNRDGRVRERSVRELAKSGNAYAIQFIIFRLADWVEEVRKVAIRSLEKYKKPAFIDSLVANIATFERLQSVERVNLSDLYGDFIDFIIVRNKGIVLAHFGRYSERSRMLLSRNLVNSAHVTLPDLQLLLSDKQFVVRRTVLMHFEKLTDNEVRRLLKDRSSTIRYRTLWRLRGTPTFPGLAVDFVADDSAEIRDLVRRIVIEAGKDLSAMYASNLQRREKITGSLGGIAELGEKRLVPSVEPFLNHASFRVRKGAFLALRKLDEDKAVDYATANLGTRHAGLRNAMVDLLGTNRSAEGLEKAREIFSEGDKELKLSMLKLFSKIGRWSAIGDLMLGTVDGDKDVRDSAVHYLKRWRVLAVSCYTPPRAGELAYAIRTFEVAFTFHEKKAYYPDNPLAGIDFYLR